MHADWAVFDVSQLDESWRQQPGTPVYAANLNTEGVRKALAEASPERKPELRARPNSSIGKPQELLWKRGIEVRLRSRRRWNGKLQSRLWLLHCLVEQARSETCAVPPYYGDGIALRGSGKTGSRNRSLIRAGYCRAVTRRGFVLVQEQYRAATLVSSRSNIEAVETLTVMP